MHALNTIIQCNCALVTCGKHVFYKIKLTHDHHHRSTCTIDIIRSYGYTLKKKNAIEIRWRIRRMMRAIRTEFELVSSL